MSDADRALRAKCLRIARGYTGDNSLIAELADEILSLVREEREAATKAATADMDYCMTELGMRSEEYGRERALADKLAEALKDVTHSCASAGESSFGFFIGYKIVISRDQLELLRSLVAEHAKARVAE